MKLLETTTIYTVYLAFALAWGGMAGTLLAYLVTLNH